MFSRILLVFLAFTSFVICSSRTLGPSPDNSMISVYMVDVDRALYHDDCNKYHQLLRKVLRERSSECAPIYCFKYVMSGFVAGLTEEEAEKLKGEIGILSVTKDRIYSIDGPLISFPEINK